MCLLKERFGNPQVLISAHLDALIKLKRVKSLEDVECLRKLYDEVETCVRNLKSLEVETKTYGCLLIPILKDKLPEGMLMLIARGFEGEIWTLEGFLKFFNRELKAKESLSFSKKEREEKNNRGELTTAGSLHLQSGSFKKCVFCLGKHAPSHCDRVIDVNERKRVLRRYSKFLFV